MRITSPGARLRGLTPDRALGPDGPVASARAIDFEGTAGWREAAYLVPHGGGTLITCDAVQNCADTQFASALARVVSPLLGFTGGVKVPPPWRRTQKLAGDDLGRTLGPLAGR